eukprot:6245517-Pyramimonas_sp.AAC.1
MPWATLTRTGSLAPRTQLDSSLAGAFAELNADFTPFNRAPIPTNPAHPYQPVRTGGDSEELRRTHSNERT